MEFPGDDVIPDAGLVFDRYTDLAAAPEAVWPWVVQLGKQRAGWYLPATVERWLPRGRRATRRIEPRWQQLARGDRIPDYGRGGWFEVHAIEPPYTLVYWTQRGRTRFSWALLLERPSPGRTRLHLRFRGQIRSTGIRRTLIRAGGGFLDWSTTELLFRGLRERV